MKNFLVLLLLLCFAVPALALTSAVYLTIPGIKGDASDREHRDAIECISMKGPNVSGTSGPITLRKYQDSASTGLMAAACSGTPIGNVIVDLSSPGASGSVNVVQKFLLTKATVKEANIAYEKLNEGVRPVEEIVLSYEMIEWQTIPVGPDGSKGTIIKDTWNNQTRAKM